MSTPAPTQDASAKHWIYRLPKGWVPYAQLSRLDRPVGYWLLALPGWIGLAFAGLSHGLAASDFFWALLIFIGAVAMRGAGCTYNDIVDRDLDAQVARTALRPIPAGTVSVRQAKAWMFAQIGIGFLVWLALPVFAKGVALLSLPLVAAYPFMKRITWWPQLWLGLTFNWAFLVAIAIKTGTISIPALIFYLGLIFWTVGYDTIYACQDIEDDALVGIKSTARRQENRLKKFVSSFYGLALLFWGLGIAFTISIAHTSDGHVSDRAILSSAIASLFPAMILFSRQIATPWPKDKGTALATFKESLWVGLGTTVTMLVISALFDYARLTAS